MLTNLVIYGAWFLAAYLVLVVIRYALSRNGSQPLYSDDGPASRAFVDPVNRIRAKPDRLEGTHARAVLREKKSRVRPVIYDSDRAQVRASVLAVRASGINVVSAEVETGDGTVHPVSLPETDERIEALIREPMAAARTVARGGVPHATPTKAKCRGCGFAARCPHATR